MYERGCVGAWTHVGIHIFPDVEVWQNEHAGSLPESMRGVSKAEEPLPARRNEETLLFAGRGDALNIRRWFLLNLFLGICWHDITVQALYKRSLTYSVRLLCSCFTEIKRLLITYSHTQLLGCALLSNEYLHATVFKNRGNWWLAFRVTMQWSMFWIPTAVVSAAHSAIL